MSVIYEEKVWDQYARAFLAVMPSQMLELNKAVATYAIGNVGDFGCGAAKIAPFILHHAEVTHYTGIDYSMDMVNQARWHLEHFPEKPASILHGKIELINDDEHHHRYDFGLSINSYYTWDAPEKVLMSIYNALTPKAEFILVTPNPRLNMAALLQQAERELIANPYFVHFKEQNMALAGNEKALFVEMDFLIGQVRDIGFKVVEANTAFYDGGLNFLRLTK